MADRTASPAGNGRQRQQQRQQSKLPIHRFSYVQLLIVPALLAAGFVALVVALSLHDVNPGLLYSQCHARARVPWLSRVPLLGAPACYLVSFFQEALASARSAASLAEILSLVGGLLTVTTVEAARLCNASATLIAHPTGPWLVFNLAGGQLVWAFVIVPAFLRRAKGLASVEQGPDQSLAADSRNLAFAADAVAVPLSVLLGFVAPSAAMLATNSPAAIFVWLFFPVYVAVVRRGARWGLVRFSPERAAPSFRLERSRKALVGVYGAPVACSVAAHVWNLVALLRGIDDRREMTRSTVKFIEIDAAFIALTVLYWVLVEGGWRPAGLMVLVSVLLGPGAGACAAWLYREWTAHAAGFVEGPSSDPENRDGDPVASEETPLLG